MKIRMTQPEITQILLDAVLANLSLKSGSTPTIDFSATRGEDGIVAEIDVPYMGIAKLDLNAYADPVPAQPPTTPYPEPPAPPAVEPSTTVTGKPPRKQRQAKELFGALTAAKEPVQDPAAEQAATATDASAVDEAPFADAVTADTGDTEAASASASGGAAGEAETPPPQKPGKSLFD